MFTVILVLFLADGGAVPIVSFADDLEACERARVRMILTDKSQGKTSDYQCVRLPKSDRNT